MQGADSGHKMRRSLSARRAWIEIASGTLSDTSDVTSLSARRAWIEMDVTAKTGLFTSVALRKESVDRNKCSFGNPCRKPCRSPQGERG